MPDRPRAYFFLALAAGVGTLFGVQGMSAVLPAIEEGLGVSEAQLGLFTAAYMLPAVVFALPLGYLSDALGRRRVFVAMAVLYAAAGGAQGLTTDYELLLLLRFLQGIGFGALMPLSITLIGDAYRGAAQLRAQSHRQIAMATGEFVLPLVGAALAVLSWRLALGAQALVLPLALAGALILSDARPERDGAGYARELTEVVRQPGMPGVLTAGFLRFMCKFALIAYLPLMLVNDRGATLAQAAFVLGLASGIAALVNLGILRLLERLPASRMLIGAVLLVGASLIGFALAPSWEIAIVAAVAFGVGDGVLNVVQNALVTEAAPERVRAGLVAVASMTRNAGKLGAPLAMGALILTVSLPYSFVFMGVAAWAAVPALRPVRDLDGLLAGGIHPDPAAADPI